MRVFQVHNRYQLRSGECVNVDAEVEVLNHKGIALSFITRNNKDISGSLWRKILTFFGSIYSAGEARAISRMLCQKRPDIVHVHNVYPIFSPSILVACRQAGIHVVMTCYNYRLICPIATNFHQDNNCEKCHDGREYRCILRNCRKNIFENTAFTLQHYVGRKHRLFSGNVTNFIMWAAQRGLDSILNHLPVSV